MCMVWSIQPQCVFVIKEIFMLFLSVLLQPNMFSGHTGSKTQRIPDNLIINKDMLFIIKR